MAIRLNNFLRENNINIQHITKLLNYLGYDNDINCLTYKLPDDFKSQLKFIINCGFTQKDIDQWNFPYNLIRDKPPIIIKKIGKINLNQPISVSKKIKQDNENKKLSLLKQIENIELMFLDEIPSYNNHSSFQIKELICENKDGTMFICNTGDIKDCGHNPEFSLFIGPNGVGKSSMLRNILDFFIDVRKYVNLKRKKTVAEKNSIKCIKYTIDGVECIIGRFGTMYTALIDNKLRPLKYLHFPSIIACHFGAFDKFPVQSINNNNQNRYAVPYYKYVGAHVGNIVSASAITFRLLFTLSVNMSERKIQNVIRTLNFVGFDAKISLFYQLKTFSHNDSNSNNKNIENRFFEYINKDCEFLEKTIGERHEIAKRYSKFYNSQIKNLRNYEYAINFNQSNSDGNNRLKMLYKFKQYNFFSKWSISFFKNGESISSEDISSGEICMLSTILSISALAGEKNTLILLDEPELNQHPNWQMSIIEKLDESMKNISCHFLIGSHSHLLVSDLPMNRSSVVQIEKDEKGCRHTKLIQSETYGWSAEEVLVNVFQTATDRNRYFSKQIATFLENIANNKISRKKADEELSFIKEVGQHLSDIDPMKKIIETIIDVYNK